MTEPEPAPEASDSYRIRFPPELPISARVGDIAAAIASSPVVVVAGATGSGKTTQLPKVALQMGRGNGKLIGITQPRRIAATSVAARVASELECPLGAEVGYQIRFEDRTSQRTRLKFMTDGILLAEIQADRLLRRYDTLIIDEAHERSLTIDFLLGWLQRILPERPDLKVLVSSATIETERFAKFFGGAPVVQVEGRTFPVDVLYEPFDPELDLHDAVANAVENVTSLDPRGDILVFLPGEREIREAEQEIGRRNLRNTSVQPLYSRLTASEQSRVFAPVPGRRVILATNVAETSLTIPGIVYVIDTGSARLSRYDARTGTTRLLIEAISQASADQRKGRSGRVREGICIRLYDEASFQARPAFTDPEILRTGLAGVILRMKSLGLGDVEDFPFLDTPNTRSIGEGYRVLEELGALDDERQLTPLGRRLARLPVDPRIGRMILAAAERQCVSEVLVVASALELMDPRERPRGAEQKADALHRRFRDERSDFVGLLRLWEFVREAQRKSTSHLKRVCKDNYLSFVRVREWFEVHRQLSEVAKEIGIHRGPRSSRAADGGAATSGEHVRQGKGGQAGDDARRTAGREAAGGRGGGAPDAANGSRVGTGEPRAAAGAAPSDEGASASTASGDRNAVAGRRRRRSRGGKGPGAGAPRAGAPGAAAADPGAMQKPNPAREATRGGGAARGGGPSTGAASEGTPGERPANEDALHQALLGGLLSRIGMYNPEQRVYVGARQTRFVIHPSSGLAKKPPAWVMAHELVQTTQLFARNVARLDPLWLDEVGHHLLKRSYADPHWSEKSGRAKVREHATLYGLPVLKDRSVDYAAIAPVRARLMFLEHALVRGEYVSRGAFQAKNRALLEEVARLRDKARQSGMLSDDEALLAFFEQRVPASVTNGKDFEAYRERVEKQNPNLLCLTLADVLAHDRPLLPEHYPDSLTLHGVELHLVYKFDPSAEDDGITLSLPLGLLPQLEPGELDWTIPAWQRDKVAALLETLPRALRKELGSSPALADTLAAELTPFSGSLLGGLAAAVQRATGVLVPAEAFRLDAIPRYLNFMFRVVGEQNKTLAAGRDLGALLRAHSARAREAFTRTSAPPQWERSGVTTWDFGDMPEFVTRPVLGTLVRAYPAIVDRQKSVDLALLESKEAASAATREGVRRLCALASQRALTGLGKRVPPPFPRTDRMPHPRSESDAFRERVTLRVVEEAFGLGPGAALPRNAAEFSALLVAGQRRLDTAFERVTRAIAALNVELDKLQRALVAAAREPSGTNAARDIRAQLELLMAPDPNCPDPVGSVELAQLEQYPRYLRAAQTRLTRAITDPRKDADKAAPLAPIWAMFLDKRRSARDATLARLIHFELEELRVAIFAPELKPARAVNASALAREVAALR